jgi:uncharacterized SAM-binding protein YcdF (DUF218 family)
MLWNRFARALGATVLVVFVISAYTPVWNNIAIGFADPGMIGSSDAIVVLAGSLSPEATLTDEAMRRVLHGIELHKDGLAPLLVLSGSHPEEAHRRAALALSMGIPPDAILIERTSHTTRDESVKISELLTPHDVKQILLVTQSLHMPRATLVFERAGFSVIPAASDDYPTSLTTPTGRVWLMSRILQEMLALMYYKASGYV